jgi:hypothetical protein
MKGNKIKHITSMKINRNESTVVNLFKTKTRTVESKN